MSNLELNESNILTRKEVKSIFKVSDVTIYNWVKKGVIPEHKLGHSCYYLKDEILSAFNRNASSTG